MEKRRRTEAVSREFLLPEVIIQHIQSFLSGKEAAQTTVLSQSWNNAWLTRPDLVFDARHFGCYYSNCGDENGFREFAKKTMQRYEELNLKIESLSLWMKGNSTVDTEHDSYFLANELILKAMKMGATHLDFELQYRNKAFVLPHEVFGYENLLGLSATGCKIGQGVGGMVSCSKLKSLRLLEVYVEGDIIWDIISSCPLIENLVLCDCSFEFQSSSVISSNSTRRLGLSPFIEFGKQNVGLVVDGPIKLYEFHKLKCLVLRSVDILTLFFHDFSSKFPCLKDLSLHYCGGFNDKGIKISSPSLECISIKHDRVFRAKFDVPNLRKLDFSGSRLPAVSLKTASMEWESDISIWCKCLSTSWFRKLKKSLTNLSLSKISLSLTLAIKPIVEKSVDFGGLPIIVVENLTMQAPSSVCSTLLESLFQSCRPKFITQYWLPESGIYEKENNDFLVTLCKRLMRQVNQHSSIPEQTMFGPWDLEEVNLELFEESLAEWQPQPLTTLLHASASPKNKQKIRFQLRGG